MKWSRRPCHEPHPGDLDGAARREGVTDDRFRDFEAVSLAGFQVTGRGESTVRSLWNQGSLRPAKHSTGELVRRLLYAEVFIPTGVQDRPILMELRDIPLKRGG